MEGGGHGARHRLVGAGAIGGLVTDLDSSVECFRDERFCELETLGPLELLSPGHEAVHHEVWTVLDVTADALEDILATLPDVPPVPFA